MSLLALSDLLIFQLACQQMRQKGTELRCVSGYRSTHFSVVCSLPRFDQHNRSYEYRLPVNGIPTEPELKMRVSPLLIGCGSWLHRRFVWKRYPTYWTQQYAGTAHAHLSCLMKELLNTSRLPGISPEPRLCLSTLQSAFSRTWGSFRSTASAASSQLLHLVAVGCVSYQEPTITSRCAVEGDRKSRSCRSSSFLDVHCLHLMKQLRRR